MSNLLQLLQGTPRRSSAATPSHGPMPDEAAPASAMLSPVESRREPHRDPATDTFPPDPPEASPGTLREQPASGGAARDDEAPLALLDGPVTGATRTGFGAAGDGGTPGTIHQRTTRSADRTTPASGDADATLARVFEPAAAVRSAGSSGAAGRRGTRLLLGALVAVALAVGASLWLLMPASDDSTLLSLPPADGSLATAAPDTDAAVNPAVAAPAATPVRGTPATPRGRAGSRRETIAPAPVAADASATDWYDTTALDPGVDDMSADGAATIRFTRSAPTAGLLPGLTEAYAAFTAGDLGTAATAWQDVLRREPGNVDALLGLAAIAARSGRPGDARRLYADVLRANPHNSAAVAAMSLLPGDGSGPAAAAESGLKVELRANPDAADLHFALALRYVAEGRWPEAQQEFFAATTAAPANADYAYNLAVSLDRLGQAPAAAAYYERALRLATGSESFDRSAATGRLATLRSPGN